MSDVDFRGARYDAGLAWVHFPVGFGGLGLRPEFNKVVEQRCRAAGAAATDPTTFFMALAGPTIVTHGSDEAKERFLRPMFTGEEKWCQLFSEPDAGSDLGAVQTRATYDEETGQWRLNGVKRFITNGNADVQRLGLGHLFDFSLSAVSTGKAKPHPRMFEEACRRAHVAATRLAHIGDEPGTDLAGAQNAKVTGIWMNRRGQTADPVIAHHAEIRNMTELLSLLGAD